MYVRTYYEEETLTSRHKITQDGLACNYNQLVKAFWRTPDIVKVNINLVSYRFILYIII